MVTQAKYTEYVHFFPVPTPEKASNAFAGCDLVEVGRPPSTNGHSTCCAFSLRYFDSINVTEKEAWRPWTTDGKQRMGGYVITYPGDLYYLTVRGSGHMVPEYKPEVTLAFIDAFIQGKEFPRYKGPPGFKSRRRPEL